MPRSGVQPAVPSTARGGEPHAGSAEMIAGALFVVGAVAIYALLLRRLRSFERAHDSALPWWFGYARDGVNLLGFAALFAGLGWCGYPGPQALLLAIGVTLAAYLVDAGVGHLLGSARAPWVVVLTAGVVAAALALEIAAVTPALERVLASIQIAGAMPGLPAR